MTRTTTLLAALVAALTAYSCRPALDISCEGDDCTSAQGGAAGAPPYDAELGGAAGADSSPGGQGGADDVVAPECAEDGDCEDGTFCNGAETCRKAACKPAAAAIECPTQTTCTEDDDGAGAGCRFSPNERFYLCSGDDFGEPFNAVGLPLTQSEPSPVSFSQGVNDEEFQLYTYEGDRLTYSWSPNGRRVVFSTLFNDFDWDLTEQKFYYVDVAAPIAEQPLRLPEIPINNRALEVVSWSADGNALVLDNYLPVAPEGGGFVVRFTETGGESATLPADGVAFICADNATVALNVGGNTRLLRPWEPGAPERVLPLSTVSISPDGKMLLVSDEDVAWLAPCSLDSKPELLAGSGSPGAAASWSSDSRYVIVSDTTPEPGDGPTPTTLRGYLLESQNVHSTKVHLQVFEATAAAPHVLFEPGTGRFVYPEHVEDGPPVWHAIDLDEAASDLVLPVPPDVEPTYPDDNGFAFDLAWLGSTGAIIYSSEEHGLNLLPVAPATEPRPSRSRVFSEDGAQQLFTEEEVLDGVTYTQAYSLAWADGGALPVPLFSEPFAGSLSFRNASVLVSDDADVTALYALPAGASTPVRLNRGKNAYKCSLQPQR